MIYFLISLSSGWIWNRMTRVNKCHMTYMRPSYERLFVPKFEGLYQLLRYTGDGGGDEHNEIFVPLLFVPGHKGNAHQVRSLGSHLRRLDASIELYTIDFKEEPVALHGEFIWKQARFICTCARLIASRHPDAGSIFMVQILHHLYYFLRFDSKFLFEST